MIDDALRRSFLRSFPATVAVTVIATRPTAYLLEGQQRPGLTVHAIDAAGTGAIAAGTTVVVDDLADLTDPAALLAHVRDAVPRARLFALASNAAYAPTLARFTAGAPFPLACALVAAELPALFARANYRTLSCTPVAARADDRPLPYHVVEAGVVFDVASAAEAERLGAAGYLVVADPQ
jgi:hypothetical protein